jgi:very-short-patch-repair endonuclease
MNFGPMNRQGGERRLNVAITRARQELRVFSSLRPEQMDLSRTQALGVRDLKHFLEFAERGARALGEAVAGSIGGFDSPFEQAVCVALSERGWTLHSQVGVSAFRIDLGVIDPDAPGRYLSGIECDGATYHRSATARDRDKLREQVLRGLGWEILRIWSTDWWIDKAGTVEKIHGQLEALLSDSRSNRLAEAATAEAMTREAIAVAMAKTDTALGAEAKIVSPVVSKPSASKESVPYDETERTVAYAKNASKNIAQSDARKQFVETDLAAAGFRVEPGVFFDANYDKQLLQMIEHVVVTEGPVRDEVVARRIARAHGWSRTGTKIHDRVVRLAARQFQDSKEPVGAFFWPEGSVVGSQICFRQSSDGAARSVDEICLQELAHLALEMVNKGYDQESGITAMAREMGLLKLRAATRERLQHAWTQIPNDSD